MVRARVHLAHVRQRLACTDEDDVAVLLDLGRHALLHRGAGRLGVVGVAHDVLHLDAAVRHARPRVEVAQHHARIKVGRVGDDAQQDVDVRVAALRSGGAAAALLWRNHAVPRLDGRSERAAGARRRAAERRSERRRVLVDGTRRALARRLRAQGEVAEAEHEQQAAALQARGERRARLLRPVQVARLHCCRSQ
eukprot:scaffold119167_cov49-Phaeocystis_antarctica.AAC.5